MPPVERFVCRFAAEPPQEPLPYGRWAERLAEHFRDGTPVIINLTQMPPGMQF